MGFSSAKKDLEKNKQLQNIKNNEIENFKKNLENYEDDNLLNKILDNLRYIVNINKLDLYYNEKKLNRIANDIIKNDILAKISENSKITDEKYILKLCTLSLYNIILFADDSGSMKSGDRIKDIREITIDISNIITLLDDDGISFKAFNYDDIQHEINTAEKVNNLIDKIKFNGNYTPIGTNLQDYIIKFLKELIENKIFDKPALVIIITDGEPNEPDRNHKKLYNIIKNTKQYLKNKNLSEKSIVYSFGLVGNDEYGNEFIDSLDNDNEIGDVIDATSSIEIESKQVKNLTPELWLFKLLIGAIDPSTDKLDDLPPYTK